MISLTLIQNSSPCNRFHGSNALLYVLWSLLVSIIKKKTVLLCLDEIEESTRAPLAKANRVNPSRINRGWTAYKYYSVKLTYVVFLILFLVLNILYNVFFCLVSYKVIIESNWFKNRLVIGLYKKYYIVLIYLQFLYLSVVIH